MKVNNIKECTPAFSGALNNKAVLKGLEKISDHGASFVAGVSLCSAAFLRPAVISRTPNTDKENKRLASANSVASAVSKFIIAESVALPIENAVKRIDINPSDYLKKATINTLKTKGKDLNQSKNYRFATQLIKLGSGILSAVPKSVLTIALVPVIADNLFAKKEDIQKKDT
ncbi:MAG: hypothetical protein LUE64_03990, partial [Candidatus Gastranaerophilales bacterium]|nr:hypothetical protein [Candidatus Gastranaerophilales bacterium]